MKVRDIMTRDARLLNPNQTIREAASLMAEVDAGALPVGENDRLVGMTTDRDIVIRAVAQRRPVDTKVAAVMSKEVLYCFDTDDLDDVSRNMGKAQVRRLPVVNADKRPDNDRSNREAVFHAGRQARPDLDALTSEWQ